MAISQNQERRRNRRRKLTQLVYLEFGRENGGMIRDVSEGGMRFHLMNRVTVGEELRFGITVDPARRIEGKARMIWTDATGKSGGMSITEMSPESRATMFSWLADVDSPAAAAPASQAPRAARPQTSEAGTSEASPSAPAAVPPTPAPPPVAAPPPVVQQAPVTQPFAAPQPPAAVAPSPSVVAPGPETAWPAPAVPPVSPAVDPSADTAAAAATPPPPAPPLAAPPPPVAQQPAPTPLPEISTSLFYGIDTDLTRDPGPAPQSLVSHDDWKRAARDMEVEERASRSPATTTLEERPAAPPRRESRKYSELADHVDPMREFLKSPLGAIPEPHRGLDPQPEEHELPLPVQTNQPRAVSKSRVGVVLLLAIVCGLGVAYAGIVYRQPLGRLIISLGQMIAGEESSALPSVDPASGARQNPSADTRSPYKAAPDTPSADKGGTSAVAGSAANVPSQTSAPAPPSGVPVIPPYGKAATPNATETLAQSPTPNRSSASQQSVTRPPATAQPELTSGAKEIVPGKPRRLPDDVASLWQAVENGDAVAEVALANHYAVGAGVEKNCAQARVLLEAAAKRGSEPALKRLIQLRSSGCQ
jgi:PilZ domain